MDISGGGVTTRSSWWSCICKDKLFVDKCSLFDDASISSSESKLIIGLQNKSKSYHSGLCWNIYPFFTNYPVNFPESTIERLEDFSILVSIVNLEVDFSRFFSCKIFLIVSGPFVCFTVPNKISSFKNCFLLFMDNV